MGRVLISGAGIAGPALAYWLRRYGYDVTVVERAAQPRPGGQAIDVRGVARTVVERMGLMPAVRAAALDQKGFAYVNASGRMGARMPVDLFGGEGIVSEIEILRGDLAQVLLDATRDVEYRYGDAIAALDQDEHGVRVTFESGARDAYDLVIGADGTHSRTRALAFGPESAFAHPLGVQMAYFTTPIRTPVDGWFLMYNAPGQRVAAIRPDRDGRAKAMLAYAASDESLENPRDLAVRQREFRAAFDGVGWLAPQLLDSMADAPDFYVDSLAQVKMDGWSRGRVALLGDAACSPSPLTGLGTSLSLVGAYVLAGELAAANGNHRVAYGRYEEKLRGYVRQAQELPPGGVNGFLPRTRFAIAARSASMRMMTAWPMRRMLAGVFSKADAIDLPDYDIAAHRV